jgi:hypothetical protein
MRSSWERAWITGGDTRGKEMRDHESLEQQRRQKRREHSHEHQCREQSLFDESVLQGDSGNNQLHYPAPVQDDSETECLA